MTGARNSEREETMDMSTGDGRSFGTRLAIPYAEAVERVKSALRDEGFGVLSEIDVRQVLKEKRNVDFRPYVILGACNPVLAERAFAADLGVGLVLPCNVVVYEDGDQSVAEVVEPAAMLAVLDRPELRPIADEAKAKLERAIASLGGQAFSGLRSTPARG